MKIKKIAAIAMSFAMAAALFGANAVSVYGENPLEGCVPGNADIIADPSHVLWDQGGPMEGCVPGTVQEIQGLCGDVYISEGDTASLPSYIDNSSSPCFPEIGNQGGQTSCSSFASTYYQYSYEVNKLNNVTDSSQRTVYSPKWTYNFTNYGRLHGSSLGDSYKILENFGCLKLSDLPYTGNVEDYQETPEAMQAEKLEALKTRMTGYGLVKLGVTDGISSPTSPYLYNLKNILSSGKVVVGNTENRFDSMMSGTDCIAYRCINGSGGHSVCIVGYDDSKWVDINGDGVKQAAETGALKVANSWGTTFNAYGISSTDGYFWVSYDALNKTTQVSGSWQGSLSGSRIAAFSYESADYNYFYSMNVAHKAVNLAGKININTMDKKDIKLILNRTISSNTSWITTGEKEIYTFNNGSSSIIPFDGYLIFDYDSFANPIASRESGFNWFAKLGNCIQMLDCSFQLIDDLGNSITPLAALDYKADNTMWAYQTLSVARGDLNYDGALTPLDTDIIRNAVAGQRTLSSLQSDIGDIDRNGSITLVDLILMCQIAGETNTKCMEGAVKSNDINGDIYDDAVRSSDFVIREYTQE